MLAVFCPINESVWEHLKMAYWPVVLLTGVQLAVTEVSTTVSATLLTARAIGFYAMCVAHSRSLLPDGSPAAPRQPCAPGWQWTERSSCSRWWSVRWCRMSGDCDERWPWGCVAREGPAADPLASGPRRRLARRWPRPR